MNQLKKYLPEHKKVGNKYFQTKDNAEYSGIYLGEEEKEFIPSLMFLEMLQDKLKTLVVSKKAAWNFSKGKNVPKESIIEEKGKSSDNLMLVANRDGDILGIIDENYKNIFDLGYYLRREI